MGSHLLEKLRARGNAVRCLVRPATNTRRLPQGVETALADLSSGQGLDRALRRRRGRHPPGGRHQACHRADYFSGNAARHRNPGAGPRGPLRSAWYTSAAWRPSDRAWMAGRWTRMSAPHPVSTYGKSKLEGEKIVARARSPDAVIIRPPVVYGPRDTDVFQILKSGGPGLVLEISGGERWFSAIYVEDLADGLCDAAAGTPMPPGELIFWLTRGGFLAGIGRHRGAAHEPPSADSPCARGGSQRDRIFSPKCGRASRGILLSSRERRSRKLVAGSGPAIAARAAAELGFEAPTPLGGRLGQNPSLVQGGGLAQILTPWRRCYAQRLRAAFGSPFMTGLPTHGSGPSTK